ncbi:serine protease 44 [Trichonephila inaurata madagascariensis]|uniref:Serine protease 44 n=1 Tax=Trichonephila inaurata madagascariensis TaxID=2747483 RepID=A0A8X6XN43_9ARAC|nr:serine protease 44 [Trichonephila inaurata madagascariensis]
MVLTSLEASATNEADAIMSMSKPATWATILLNNVVSPHVKPQIHTCKKLGHTVVSALTEPHNDSRCKGGTNMEKCSIRRSREEILLPTDKDFIDSLFNGLPVNPKLSPEVVQTLKEELIELHVKKFGRYAGKLFYMSEQLNLREQATEWGLALIRNIRKRMFRLALRFHKRFSFLIPQINHSHYKQLGYRHEEFYSFEIRTLMRMEGNLSRTEFYDIGISEVAAVNSSCDCGRANEVNPLIIGGSEVNPPHKYPWMVAIKSENSSFICGGSLITTQYVLTAAHCLTGAENFMIGIGVHDLSEPQQEIRSMKIKMHPHDIALIMLETPVTLSENIRTICLPYDPQFEKPGTKAVVAGWGKLYEDGPSSQVLMEADLQVMESTESSIGIGAANPDTPKATGRGDSGSPLFFEYSDDAGM